jgi:hypothetical protein
VRVQLLENHAPSFGDELLGTVDERFTTNVVARLPLLCEHFLDDVLCSDSRVVCAREPQDFVATHPAPPDNDVLHGVVEAVAHVKHRRHVRWRHHDHVGLALTAGAN